VGGIGLTGIILTASFRMLPVESAYMKVDYHKVKNLDAALGCMQESDAAYRYSVTWLDSLARGGSLGRGVVMLGNHAKQSDLSKVLQQHPFEIPVRKKKNVPIDVPSVLMNKLSIKMLNNLFYATHSTSRDQITDYDQYFYPLDGIKDWNRGYGKMGFAQYQATFPGDDPKGVRTLLEKFVQSGYASFVTVLKRMGEANPGMLSHPFKGYTISFDIPNDQELVPFLHELDKILLEFGARLYLAKDIAATAETIAAMYPRLDEFRTVKQKLDPEHKLTSSLARRLGIVEGGGV
jgi:FAD/FMN-containing dehydrogenase